MRRFVALQVAEGKIGAKTINNAVGVLSVALGHAEEDGLIVRKPAATRRGGRNKDALQAAGLRTSVRLHDLRHTAAASWLAVGLPMLYVQHQLGHSSIVTTQQQYGHLEESFLRGAPVRAEEAIWGAPFSDR